MWQTLGRDLIGGDKKRAPLVALPLFYHWFVKNMHTHTGLTHHKNQPYEVARTCKSSSAMIFSTLYGAHRTAGLYTYLSSTALTAGSA